MRNEHVSNGIWRGHNLRWRQSWSRSAQRVSRRWLAVALLLFWYAGAAHAQEDVTSRVMGLDQVLQSGGWILYVLGVLSVLMLAFVIYFCMTLRPGQIAPARLLENVLKTIRSGDLEDARQTCEQNRSPLAAVAGAAITYLQETGLSDPELLRDVVEGEGSRQAELLQGHTDYLQDIAVVAPMIGLLGTVFGMLRAFSSVALDIAQAKPVVLAAGVSQALVTTAAGLLLGIPAMMFYAYFRRRAARMVAHLEVSSADVLTALTIRSRS